MSQIDGVPRENTPALPFQKLEKRVRDLELKSNARRKVALSSLIEGAAPPTRVVAEQLTETVKEHLVVEGDNLAVDALDGRVITGSTIRTAEQGARVIIDETGLRGYGADGNEYMNAGADGLEMNGQIATSGQTGGANPKPISVRLTTIARNILGETVPNPGLVFHVDGTDRGVAPGVYSPDGESLQLGTTGPSGSGLLTLGPQSTTLLTYNLSMGAPLRPQVSLDGETNTLTLGNDSTFFGPITNVNLVGNVTVNGAPIGSGGGGSDSGWLTATYLNGWMDYGNGFGGLQYRKKDGVLYLRGSIKGGSFYTSVAQLPEGFRPVVPAGTSAMEFPITVIASNGTAFTAGTMFAYSNGTLTYYSPPSTWVGPDRVIINNAFPL